jgi:hypothetical protein
MRKAFVGLIAAAAMALTPVLGYAASDPPQSGQACEGGNCYATIWENGVPYVIIGGAMIALAVFLAGSGGHQGASTSTSTATATH